MKNLLLFILTVVCLSFACESIAQCECTDCPIPIIDNTVTTSCLEVSGLTNPTLGVAGQDVCGIEIQFDHTWLTEVSFTLITPDGSSVVLVPNDGFGSTPNSTWDIDFVPCADSADPDSGFPAIFNPAGYSNGAYFGTYYPGVGCFEDLTGSANGTWKLEVEDFFVVDEGEVTTWSIIFCDGTGTDCGPEMNCEADAGSYNFDTQFLCIDGPDLILDPVVSGQAPLPDYEYTFTISNYDTGQPLDIIEYSDDADFNGYSQGLYLVCGLSYLATDEALLPIPDGTLTNDDIQDDIDNMEYCADLESFCIIVIIDDHIDAPEIVAPDTLCVDEVGELFVLNYDPDYLWLIDIDGNFSTLNLLFFPTISYAGGGNTDEVEICVEFVSACGNMTTCVSTVIVGAVDPNLEIIGETETCYGNTYEYTISGLDGISNYNWYIDPFEDSFIIGSSTGETVTVGLPAIPDQFSASICFEYEDYCGNMDEICIDITPNDLFIDDDLTPETFCGLSGDFNIVASGGGGGTWVQDSGPGTSVYVNENELNTNVTVSASGNYTFTFSTDCGNMYTLDVEFLQEPQEPMIDGVFSGCIGESLTFTASNIETSTIIGWTITGDGSIIGASDLDMVEVLLDDPGTTNVATLCLEIENSCDEVVEVCEDIDLLLETLTNQTADNFCSLNVALDVLVDGAAGSGQWILISGPGSAMFIDDMASMTNANLDAFGDYVFEFIANPCGASIQVPITVYEDIDFENLMVECIGEDFIVSFDILGGVDPYTVNGTILAGNNYSSGLISGTGYSFTVDDNSVCNNIVITGNSNCECDTDAGSISPQDLLVSCNNEDISVFSNGDAFFDPNDGAIFILYTDLLDPLGSIAIENATGVFSFGPPLQYGTVYYVAYVVGDELAGTVDYTDPCLDLATGTSIIFSEPFGFSGIETTEILSCDIIWELTSLQETSEVGEWSVISAPSGGAVIFNGTTGISTLATFSEAGTYTIQYTIDNGFCIESQEVTIDVLPPSSLSILNISYSCDDANENYQVSFEIEGGVEPYFVNGVLITDNTFSSMDIASGTTQAFSITDANGCEPVIFVSDFTCLDNCVSYAELELEDLVELCEGESYTAMPSENSILENDDIGVFILHTNSGNVLGTVLDQNETGEFTYLPTLDFEEVYYISYVVGNEIAGNVDLSDECLSVAPGQSIVFHELPSAMIEYTSPVCSFDFEIHLNDAIGDSWTWSLITGPLGGSIAFIDITEVDVLFSADLEGEYILQLLMQNGSCAVFDTIIVEVLEESSVEVMNDFSSCNKTFDIQSITVGSPKSWEVVGATGYTIESFEEDTTSITFDSSGTYEIVRRVGSGICEMSDTFFVEIYEESSFDISNIICAEDKLTYSIEYEIVGDSYPYSINGQLVNEGQEVELSADSGNSIVIAVFDVNQCELFNDTIVFSCECESDPGQMDDVPIEACFDETITVLPSVGSIAVDSDSLVYVLHSSSGMTITDIIAVSATGEFSFNTLLMSYNTTYYVSAVVFIGSSFSASVLDDVCTIASTGTPVLWFSENRVELPGYLVFCEDDVVEISVVYSGIVPMTIRLSDGMGNSYDVSIDEEGENNYIIDLIEPGILFIDWYFGTSCSLDVEGELEIGIKELPDVQFVSEIVTCNSSISGSTIVLDELIILSNTSGTWIDQNGNPVSGTIDFDGLPEGIYLYHFNTTGNAPCDEVSYLVPITVEDCDCPLNVLLPFDDLCQGDYALDLNDYLNANFIGLGAWAITTINGSGDLVLMDSDLTINVSNYGFYQATFTFYELPQGCDLAYSFDFEIRELLSSGIANLNPIKFCVDDLFEIILFDYLDEYDEGGEWTSIDSIPIDILTGVVNLSMAEGGLYSFAYEIPENGVCPSTATEISILIHEPLELFLSILDPLCFGLNDGSVSAEDVDGNPVDFELFNASEEIVSNPDSLFAGDYELWAVDQNGCIILENFSLVDPLELFLDLGEDRVIEEGELTTISPVINFEGDDISLFQWFANQSILDIPTFDTLIISPDGETNIQLIITDEDGCIVADDLLLTILDREIPIILANIFNPDNGTFGIEAFEGIEIVNRFSIYDRWGALMHDRINFSPADLAHRWDGTKNGTDVMNGVYVFAIDYTNNEGRAKSIFGDITVIRN